MSTPNGGAPLAPRNPYRGETPFRALGRELFLVYRTSEIARMQAALGLSRPDPLAKPIVEEVPALNLENSKPAEDVDGRRLALLDEEGRPKMRQVIVDAWERHRRQIDAFDAALDRPMAADLVVMIRCGLEPWEWQNGKLSAEEFDRLVEELGYVGLSELHQRALENSYRVMLPALEEKAGGSDDPNGQSPAQASRT